MQNYYTPAPDTGAGSAALAAIAALVSALQNTAAKVGAPFMAEAMCYAAANVGCPHMARAFAAALLGRAPTPGQLAAVLAKLADSAAPIVGCGSNLGAGAVPYGAAVALALPRKPLTAAPSKPQFGAFGPKHAATTKAVSGKQLALAAQAASVVGLRPAISHAIYGNGWGAGAMAAVSGYAARCGGAAAGKGGYAQLYVPADSALYAALRAAQGKPPKAAPRGARKRANNKAEKADSTE